MYWQFKKSMHYLKCFDNWADLCEQSWSKQNYEVQSIHYNI